MRVTNKLPSLTNVSAGSTAVLNLPLGLTYDFIQLEYSGVTLAQMKNIKLEVNGKIIQEFKDGNQIVFLNTYHGRPADAAGFLTLWMIRPEMHTLQDQRLTALGTSDIKTLTLRFDIDAAATAPAVKAHAVQSEPQPFGLCTKIKSFVSSTAVAGVQEIDNLPTNAARIGAIHLVKPDITDVEVTIDSMVAFQASKALAENIQKKYGKVPQTASATHIDWMLEGDMGQALTTQGVQDFRIKPTHGAAGQLDILVEYLDGLAGI